MLDDDAGLVNAKDPVGQEELQAFGLSLEFSVQIEEVQKDVEGAVRRLFGRLPRSPLLVPFLEGLDTLS